MKYPRLVSMPSAVSNWLEEQLEALGIDSAIYTRYILSLLHADVLDVIYPEEDYFLTKLKKVNCFKTCRIVAGTLFLDFGDLGGKSQQTQ